MVATPLAVKPLMVKPIAFLPLVVTWEALPDNYILDDSPVDMMDSRWRTIALGVRNDRR